MKNTPLVSVIMPAFNSSEFIRTAIKSVLDQEYINLELLVIDDASTDNTVSIAEKFQQMDPRIKILKNDINSGAGFARNKGIRKAQGDFIAFLDADDLWLPQKLSRQVRFLVDNDLSFSFSSYLLMDEEGRLLDKTVEALPVLSYQKLLKSNYVGNLTGIYDVNRLGKVYSPLVRKRQDWALWLSILKKEGRTQSIEEPLAVYRVRKNSISNKKLDLLKYNFNIYKNFLGYGYLKSSKYMAYFLLEHFFVKKKQIKTRPGK